MKDYSNFIPTPYGFITKYEIVGNQILVYTSENKKGKPHVYVATSDTIKYIDERLGNQYKMILKNRQIIKNEFIKKQCGVVAKIGVALSISTMIIGLVLAGTLGWLLPAFMGVIAATLTYGLAMAITEQMEKKFDQKLDIYQDYLNNREKIEEKRKEDENIIRYLSPKATSNIRGNEQLRESGLIDMALNIDFMDKVKLKDLRELLTSYRICEDLAKKQNFLVPNEYKKKVKKKTESKKEEVESNNEE